MQSALVRNPPSSPAALDGELPSLPEVERGVLATTIDGISKAWVSQVAQMQQLDAAFARKLAACTKPSEAAALCGSWMGHRVDSAFVLQHRLFEAWLDAITKAACRNAAERTAMTQPGCERDEQPNRPKGR